MLCPSGHLLPSDHTLPLSETAALQDCWILLPVHKACSPPCLLSLARHQPQSAGQHRPSHFFLQSNEELFFLNYLRDPVLPWLRSKSEWPLDSFWSTARLEFSLHRPR